VFCVSLGHFIPVLLAFAVLGLVSSVTSQEIGWEERLRNDLLCAQWDLNSIYYSIPLMGWLMTTVLRTEFQTAGAE